MCVCVYIYTYISEFIRCDWDRITAVAIFSDSLPTYDSGFKVHSLPVTNGLGPSCESERVLSLSPSF